jgi:hypothetical protein
MCRATVPAELGVRGARREVRDLVHAADGEVAETIKRTDLKREG